MVGVLQSLPCSRKSNNPSLKTVTKARLRQFMSLNTLGDRFLRADTSLSLQKLIKLYSVAGSRNSANSNGVKNEFLNHLHGLSILFKSVFLKDCYSAFGK